MSNEKNKTSNEQIVASSEEWPWDWNTMSCDITQTNSQTF